MDKKTVKGIIFDIDHFAVHDGKGIRSCIYLKGCPLQCQWCHSPESQEEAPQILFAAGRCTGCGACIRECPAGAQKLQEGIRYYDRDTCQECRRCVSVCRTGALTVAGTVYTAEQAAQEVLADRIFYKNSGGGVTISGGEVLMQAEFTKEILRLLKRNLVHTIVETAGYGKCRDLLGLARYTDIFYYDFKLGDKEEFLKYTGGDVDVVLDNLEELRRVTDQIVLRVPIIPGITDTEKNMELLYGTAKRLDIRQIQFLPYNTSAGAKYEWCGRTYGLGERKTDRDRLEWFRKMAPAPITAEIMD